MMPRLYIVIIIFALSEWPVRCSGNITSETSLEHRVMAMERILGNALLGVNDGNSSVLFEISLGSRQFFKNSPEVIFSVYASSSYYDLSNGYIIRFDTVVINLGDHYNPQDGIFIAPKTGIYMFHWQFISYKSGSDINLYTEIIVAGTVKGKCKEYVKSGQLHSTANMVFVEVKEKQHVWIQTDTAQVNLRPFSSFSGMLVD